MNTLSIPRWNGTPFIIAACLMILVALASGVMSRPAADAPDLSGLAQLPLAFVPNQGQLAPETRWQAQGHDSTVRFLNDEVRLTLADGSAVAVRWENANPTPALAGGERLAGVMHVLRGNDPAGWRTDIPMYGGVAYQALYPGIDLHYDGQEGTLKGTYVVAQGADPASIRWRFVGARSMQVDSTTGDLVITLPSGQQITERAPVAWQTIRGERVAVDAAYVIDGSTVTFQLGNGYDRGHALTIDPTLLYSSYLGGNATDEAKGVAVDGAGNLYIVGETASDDLLGYDTTPSGYSDLFVTKLNASGSAVQYMAIIGGPDSEYPRAIEVDGQGNAYVSVHVNSEGFPTLNPLWAEPPMYWDDGALFKLNGTGSLAYSTYLPLDVFDASDNLAVDSAGNAYVTGTMINVEAPGGDLRGNEIGLLKINPSGSSVLLNKHVGGGGWSNDKGVGIALDDTGNIYLLGTQGEGEAGNGFPTANAHQPECGDVTHGGSYCYQDATVFVLNPAGAITYASYHGGSAVDSPTVIDTDGNGNVLIAGNTTSGQFPLANPLQATCPGGTADMCNTQRGFISLLHIGAAQANLTFSSYWGAPESNSNNMILAGAIDSAGTMYVTGYTNGTQFPLQAPLQAQLNPSFCTTFGSQRYCFDSFVTKISAGGELLFSTYFGATFDEFAYDLTLDAQNNILVAGTTEADDFQTTTNGIQRTNSIGDDGFLIRIGTGTTPPATVTPTAPPIPNGKKTFLPLVRG